MKTKQSNLW